MIVNTVQLQNAIKCGSSMDTQVVKRLNVNSTPTPSGGDLDSRRRWLPGGLRFGSTTKHDTASKDRSLTPIVRGHRSFGLIDKDFGLPGTLTARELERRSGARGARDGGHGCVRLQGINRVE